MTTKGRPTWARELQEGGMHVPEIARALGISARTVFRYLKGAGSS